ncbi:hypothetical protein BHE74_00033006 [Ensete ventricosum]|nr:hypothetical protein BHE74_00033006 [Ensete ventricosum]
MPFARSSSPPSSAVSTSAAAPSPLLMPSTSVAFAAAPSPLLLPSASTAVAAASLALNCNHRWALLTLTPQPPPSPATAVLTFLPRFLVGPRCRSPRRTLRPQ